MIQRHESFQQAQTTWPMSILPKAFDNYMAALLGVDADDRKLD